jgi:hypothetical protein
LETDTLAEGLLMGLGPWTLQSTFVCPNSTSDDPVEFASMWRSMQRWRMDFAFRLVCPPDGREDGFIVIFLLLFDGRGV